MTATIDTETKTCPECAEDVQAAAKKCRHCGTDLSKSRQVANQIFGLAFCIVFFAILMFFFMPR